MIFYHGSKYPKTSWDWSLALPDPKDTGGDQFVVVWDMSSVNILRSTHVPF